MSRVSFLVNQLPDEAIRIAKEHVRKMAKRGRELSDQLEKSSISDLTYRYELTREMSVIALEIRDTMRFLREMTGQNTPANSGNGG